MSRRAKGVLVIVCCSTLVWLLIGRVVFLSATDRITKLITEEEMAIKRSDPENYHESHLDYRLSNSVGAEGAAMVFICLFGWGTTVGCALIAQNQVLKKGE